MAKRQLSISRPSSPQLHEEPLRLDSCGDYGFGPHMNLAKLKGQTSINTSPEESKAAIDDSKISRPGLFVKPKMVNDFNKVDKRRISLKAEVGTLASGKAIFKGKTFSNIMSKQ
uniref:Uncharacterized protein n=1 Tax=Strombidium inclinatum TaxID=197538 RepID=A0A7S3MVA2_9SPIT